MTNPVPDLIWGVPFLGLLLSVALGPMLAPRFWHRHMGLCVGAWALALLAPTLALHGAAAAGHEVWHAAIGEYLPFVALLGTLYTVAGGIVVKGGPWGRPSGNVALLALGTLLAGVMGTTGAAMVLIHPLLRANAGRRHRVHLVVFFILLVANIGGASSPLGDPPLYVGFLQGVPFFWPLRFLSLPLALVALPLLAVFWGVDLYLMRGEAPPPRQRLRLRGRRNLLLLVATVGVVLAQGLVPGPGMPLFGERVEVVRLLALAAFAAISAVSLAITPRALRRANDFSWEPMREIAVVFAVIFLTAGPVLRMLEAGPSGPLAPLLALAADASGAPEPLAYFWLAGMLSAFLDNAPTYLVFFGMAGGNASLLAGAESRVLEALSAGTVFFGALTYLGNAPNMMVRAIASRRGVRMPGFLTYLACAALLLLPLFAVLSLTLR
jgi:Na+/H+ antiporter NhaD/arsenite permease-like protein